MKDTRSRAERAEADELWREGNPDVVKEQKTAIKWVIGIVATTVIGSIGAIYFTQR